MGRKSKNSCAGVAGSPCNGGITDRPTMKPCKKCQPANWLDWIERHENEIVDSVKASRVNPKPETKPRERKPQRPMRELTGQGLSKQFSHDTRASGREGLAKARAVLEATKEPVQVDDRV